MDARYTVCIVRLYWYMLFLSFPVLPSNDFSTLLNRFCPNSHDCAARRFINETTTNETANSPCLMCSCDSYCQQKGNCCPVATWVKKNSLTLSENKPTPNFTCVIPRSYNQVSANPQTSSVTEWLGLYMVTSCTPGNTDQRCMQPTSDNLEENRPQTSLSTSVIYRNIYCGHCNNDTDLVPWKPYVSCSDSYLFKADQVLFPVSVEKMFQLAVSLENCSVEFQPPDNLDISSDMCYENDLVRACTNITFQEACESFSMPYFHTEFNVTYAYANVFCYLCQNSTQFTNDFDEILKFPKTTNTFVGELNTENTNGKNIEDFLLTVSDDANQYDGKCKLGYIFDPYEEGCRQWYCPMDFAAWEGSCVPVLKNVEKAAYQVRFVIRVENETQDFFLSINSTYLISSLLSTMFTTESQTKTELLLIAGNNTELSFFVVALLLIQSADEETTLYMADQFNQTYTVGINSNRKVLLNVRLAVGFVLQLVTYPYRLVQILDTINNQYLFFSYLSQNVMKIYEYPTLDKLACCLQVMLDKYEFADLIRTIRLGHSGRTLYAGEFIRVPESRNIRVCYDDYVKRATGRLSDDVNVTPIQPQVTVSVVCTAMSISCLTITIFTYAIFSELRSVPGKNNILLSTHLLIAQCFFQFTFTRTEYPELCIVFGILTHFFWLTAILWMSACTVHMFRTFVTRKTYSSKRILDPQVCIYTLCCYLFAALVVAINVGVSARQSDGKSIGYGGNICYISSPLMVGLTFALPVGIIIVINLLVFLIVIYKISESTMHFDMQPTERANTIIYMKLSTLTGATWIFGYIYIWTGFEPMEFVFIVLNAGQGVFIFLSFVCNKKVMCLYQELFRKCGRRLRRTCCKADVKLPSLKEKPANIDIRTRVCSNNSADSNKTNLSAVPTEDRAHFSPDPLPPCLKYSEKSKSAFAYSECEMDGILTVGTVEIQLAEKKNATFQNEKS